MELDESRKRKSDRFYGQVDVGCAVAAAADDLASATSVGEATRPQSEAKALLANRRRRRCSAE